MVSVFVNIAALALIVSPRNILLYRNILGNGTRLTVSIFCCRTLISNRISVDNLTHTVCIGTAFQLIPRIVGQSVAILVLRHHHNARLAIAFKVGITLYQHVSLSLHVGNGMIEMKGNIPTISAQAYHTALVISQ